LASGTRNSASSRLASTPETMPESAVSAEWRTFIEASSVRGLKRTVSSPTIVQRVFWISFLLCSAAAMLTQGYFVIQNYLSLKDISMLRSRSNFGQVSSFPSITLCNRNMLKPHANKGHITIANYSARIRDLARQAVSMREKEILLDMDKLHAYYAQLPQESMTDYTVDLKDVAVLINLVFNNGSMETVHKNFEILNVFQRIRGKPPGPNRPVETSDSIIITKFYHPEFSLCHSLHLNISDQSMKELQALRIDLAMSSHIFNTSIDSISQNYRGFLAESMSTATEFVVALHDRSVYPLNLVAQRGITVQPGGITAVRFNTNEYTYRQCLKNAQISHGRLGTYRHTPEDCSDSIVEKWLNKRLNCTDDPFAFNRLGCLKIPESNNYLDMLAKLHNYVQ
uniref:Acid-sensing ion channel 1 n=1 Tax=Macrostomum lignano TaxID=282301 RepID=A0A1I8GCN8_9PLAT